MTYAKYHDDIHEFSFKAGQKDILDIVIREVENGPDVFIKGDVISLLKALKDNTDI